MPIFPVARVCLILVTLAINSCAFKVEKQVEELPAEEFQETKTDVPAPTQFTLSYDIVNKSVFNQKCISCHAMNPNLVQLDSYMAISSSLEGIRRTTLVEKTMPKNGSLSAEQFWLLEKWISQGVPEKAQVIPGSVPPQEEEPKLTPNDPPIARVPRPVRWAELWNEVIEPKCVSCHTPPEPEGIADLTRIEFIRKGAADILHRTLAPKKEKYRMPPKPDELTTEQKELITYWVIDGMQE